MRVLLLILLIYSQSQLLFGQYPAFFNYTIENGAPSNEIYCSIQDSKGYIWIGCDAGIFRYNGVRYEQFQSQDLSARSATGLIETLDGKIYGYNFNNQLFYIENEKLIVHHTWNTLINSMAYDKKGSLWISTQKGPFILDVKSGKWKQVSTSHHTLGPFGETFTSGIRSDQEGTIYYNNYNKIITYKGDEFSGFQIPEEFYDKPMIISNSSGKPWLFDRHGASVYREDLDKWTPYSNEELIKLLKGRKITKVNEIEPGILWICTYSGVIRLNTSNGQAELIYEKLSFSDILNDNEGSLWLTTLSNGILRIPNIKIRVWDQENSGLINDNYKQVLSTTEGVFLSGSSSEIIHLTNQKELRVITNSARSDVNGLFFDGKNKVLYYHISGKLYALKNDEILYSVSMPRPVKSIIQSDNGYFVLTSQGMFFSSDLRTDLELKNKVLNDWCRQGVKIPNNENFLIAGNKGIHEIQKKKNRWVFKRTFLPGKQIISLCADHINNNVYFLSYDGAIYQKSGTGKPYQITRLNEECKGSKIFFYRDQIYIASNKGIISFNPENKSSITINKYYGLNSNNISDLSFKGDRCWAATGKGIHMIPISEFKKRKPVGSLQFRSIIVNGKKKDYSSPMVLQHNDELSIILDGLIYSSEDKFQFYYRFKNGSNKWIRAPGSTRRISILQLPYGEVDFEIVLLDHEGNKCGVPLTYSFKVIPPFWYRWWFYLALGLFAALITFLIFKYREIKIRKQQQAELARVNLENELRLSQQNALKSQMNPHFLFNVLNSIKGYIYENDKSNAVRYLSDFSNLVRMILEQSSLSNVTLEKELETLKIYIELESMLLDGEFKLELDIEDQLDISSIQIPALLLQPYVENAFKHGLRHRKGEKWIKMKIRMNEDLQMIEVKITDNGIGRKASMKLNNETHKDHQSFATSANEKRIELLNFEKEGVVGVIYNDNFDTGGSPNGTTVTIRVHV
jgi:ligand-binding sensor domain-containing protein